MNSSIIELKNIFKSFHGNTVLKNISLELFSGEALCIAGENGSGKSTMIKIISGAYEHDSGTICINGNEYRTLSPNQSMREGIQVIYQDFSLFPNLTVAENIGLSSHLLENKRQYKKSICRNIARSSLEKIGVRLDLEELVENLPVAQKQIVAIARAITQDAKVIIMDEPTTALTQSEIERLYIIINNLKQAGVGIIFVSHKLDEIFAVCDRIFVIRNGEEVINMSIKMFEREKLTYYMTGTSIADRRFTCSPIQDTELFKACDLCCKDYFHNLSFSIKYGEVLCITGRLGSGRAELAKALFGVIPIDSGSILLKGKHLKIRSINDAIRNKLAYIPDDRLAEGLFLDFSIKDNIISAITTTLRTKYGINDAQKTANVSHHWKREFAIKGDLQDPVSSLSGGNQQRVVLAKWLASNPEMIILNCPTVGVDVKSKREIYDIIEKLANQGIAVLLISDDINEILYNSNRVLVMNNGQLTHELDTKSLTYESLSEMITEKI